MSRSYLPVLLLLGFVILNKMGSDGGSAATPPGTGGSADTTETTIDPTQTTATSAPPTTPPALTPAQAKIVVANGAGIQGIAGAVSEYLVTSIGAATPTATNADNRYEKTAVYFNPAVPGADAVANQVATALGITTGASPLPATLPLEDATVWASDSAVLVLLGADATVPGATTVPPTSTG